MSVSIQLDADTIYRLELAPVSQMIDGWMAKGAIANQVQSVQFDIQFPRDPADPRELSEVPEVRLWFIRLDTAYPWFPYVLDWEAGELARYTAMLIPHQFSQTEGIQYNPEALEIFVMQKVFAIADWMQDQAIAGRNRLKLMTKTLGYELDDGFFDLIGFQQ